LSIVDELFFLCFQGEFHDVGDIIENAYPAYKPLLDHAERQPVNIKLDFIDYPHYRGVNRQHVLEPELPDARLKRRIYQ